MKKVALLALASCALALGGLSGLKEINAVKEERDASIIVKMKTNVKNKSQEVLLAEQNSLLYEISSTITSNYRIKNRYSNIFNGFVLEVPSTYVSQIRRLNRVDKVNYNNLIAEETSFNDGVRYEIQLGTNASASCQTMEKPDGTKDGSGTFMAILDTGFYIQTAEDGTQTYHNVFKPLDAVDAVISQADLKAKIDAAGEKFHGKYDATHSTYYNNKVPFYYDYGGDKQGTVNPDYDVYAEGQDHGTHVASIAGGNAGEEYEGIAPRSQMALMKVFTTYMNGNTYASGAYPAAVLSALEDCLVLGVDSINMSLGSNLNDFDDLEIVEDVIRQLDKAGTFVNVAAGNDGKGQWSGTVYRYWQADMVESNILSSYANNLAAMTVASSQADYQFYGQALTIDGQNIQFSDQVTNYNSVSGKVEYNPERHLIDLVEDYSKDEFDFVYVPNLGKIEDFDGLDVSGKVAVINRGDITFKEKVDNAVSKGAIAVAIIDNTNATEFNIRMSFSDKNDYNPAVPVVFILNKDKEVFENSESNKLKLLINKDLDNPNKRTISDYSSDGMRYDLSIKPEISAPGENIKGAILGEINSYESMSGTSMATPNMCGSTALMIGEHLNDAEYRKTIKARLMSTAEPMKDNTPEHNYTSVRRQGAGLINLSSALGSKVYLDGIDSKGEQIGKSKIELFNNDDIKAGKLNLKFAAINEGDAAVTYQVKTVVQAPGLEEFNEETYPEFAGQKFQAITDQLVEVFNDSITVNTGKNTITLPEHAIAEDKLEALATDFETGCILEGYVILTAQDQPQLSIPFLGYYGNLLDVSPVEPFNFEKEEGKIYNSDLLNYLITQSIGKTDNGDYTKADYSSQIVAGYWSDTSKVSVSSALVNNTSSLSRLQDGNTELVKAVGLNPYDNTYHPNELFVGNNGSANTIIIQQYVNRSVKDNVLTLKNKASGKVVLTDHMLDNLMGSSRDPNTNEVVYPLYKSHFDTSFFDNGYFAHRAYSIIGLYETQNKKQVNYPDGEYEMTFSYDLSAGGTYTMTYNLTIESNLPVIKSVEKTANGYRINYDDTNVAVVSINEKNYEVKKDNGKCYIEVASSDLDANTKALVKSTDTAFGKETFLTHLNDANQMMIANKMISTTYDFKVDVEGEGTNNQKLTFNITSNGKNGSTNGNITYRMLVPEGLEKATLKLYGINGAGDEKELKFTNVGDMIQFESTLRVFRLTSTGGVPAANLTGITISGPTKTQYEVGESLDLTGLVVTASYSDGSTKVLAFGDYSISDVDMSSSGKKTVTITYQDMSAIFTIQVGKTGCGASIYDATSIIFLLTLAGVGFFFIRKKVNA